MGNPGFIYDGTVVDLGLNDVQKLGGGRAGQMNATGGKVSRVTVVHLRDEIDIEKMPVMEEGQTTNDDIYETLVALESHIRLGRPFGFALDLASRIDTVLDADPLWIDKQVNGDLEEFDSANPPRPVGWTIVETGTTTVRRENKREDVFEKLFSLKFDTVGGTDQSTAQMPDSASLVATTNSRVRYRAKRGDTAADLQLSIRNVATGNYLQANGTWGASEVFISSAGASPNGGLTMGLEWGEAVHEFNNDGTAGAYRVKFRNPATSGVQLWIDDVHVHTVTTQIPLRNTAGIVVGDYYQLISRTSYHREMFKVATAPAGSVTGSDVPKFQYFDRDIFRSQNYWPDLIVRDKKPILEYLPFGRWSMKVRARQSGFGRY